MSDSNSTVFKFCPKCQCDTERHARGRCKPCANAYDKALRLKNPVKPKERQRKHVPVEVAKKRKKEIDAKRYAENKEASNLRTKKWFSENKEKARKMFADWKMRNPGACRVMRQNRRQRKKLSKGRLSIGLGRSLLLLQKGKCACCGLPLGKDYHLDHIMPLALGGSNTDENIQLLRAECNLQKSSKHPIDFMQSRGFLL